MPQVASGCKFQPAFCRLWFQCQGCFQVSPAHVPSGQSGPRHGALTTPLLGPVVFVCVRSMQALSSIPRTLSTWGQEPCSDCTPCNCQRGHPAKRSRVCSICLGPWLFQLGGRLLPRSFRGLWAAMDWSCLLYTSPSPRD